MMIWCAQGCREVSDEARRCRLGGEQRLEEEEEGDAPRCSRTHPALLPVLDHDDAAGEVEKRQLVSVVCESAQPVLEAA